MYDLEKLQRDRGSRRRFLQVMGAAGLAVAADTLMSKGREAFGATANPPMNPSGGPNDGASQFAALPGSSLNIKILNFALTLEILESDLYRQALNIACNYDETRPLGKPSDYVVAAGGAHVDRGAAFAYVRDFAFVEAAHRDFLQTVLGAAAVKPNPNGYKFPDRPNRDLRDIMWKILPLEETGVRAYLGALPYLTDLNLAMIAGGIYSTEARHSAAVRYTLEGMDAGPSHLQDGFFDKSVVPNQPSENTFEYYLDPKTVLAGAAAYFR